MALARSFLSSSELLILDEATSALDLETERIIHFYLDSEKINRTILVIAHRLSTIINSDIIYVINQGLVVGKGTHSELIKSNIYYKQLVNEQML